MGDIITITVTFGIFLFILYFIVIGPLWWILKLFSGVFGIPSELKVSIHEDLQNKYSDLESEIQVEKHNRQNLVQYYSAYPAKLPSLPTHEFPTVVQPRRSKWSNKVHISELEEFAHFPIDSLPTLNLLSGIEMTIEKPKVKRDARPPNLGQIKNPIPEPTIEFPVFSKFASLRNKWVISKHSEIIAQVENARGRWDEIEEVIEKANHEIVDTQNSVNQKYQSAMDKTDKVERQLNTNSIQWETDRKEEISKARKLLKVLLSEFEQQDAEGLIARAKFSLGNPKFPNFFPIEKIIRFDDETGILICEHQFPDLKRADFVKSVELKSGENEKSANKTEAEYASQKLYPFLTLRIATEIASQDIENITKAIVVNGWVEYIEPSTGHEKRAFVSSLLATKEELLNLNLAKVDPVAALKALKGASTEDVGIVPIIPQLKIDREDGRFVQAKDVLDGIEKDENIASMDWEDFEHLCRELFEREFAADGADVRVTQASRDQGVDAIIFDPHPVKGGNMVVQAKRYVNLVDVSAVRDLYGTVMNEGAMKGILVTTSKYGPEAYSFAKDKPLTLINGGELLGLLKKHGYSFRIDLEEARKMLRD